MSRNEPYNDIVRAKFANPVHAGDLQGKHALACVADVAESEQGARITLAAGFAADEIVEMRFRAWACPHLIAAAEWLCGGFESMPAGTLKMFDPNDLMRCLSIPEEKIGRILLLEDALDVLAEQYARRANSKT